MRLVYNIYSIIVELYIYFKPYFHNDYLGSFDDPMLGSNCFGDTRYSAHMYFITIYAIIFLS